MTGLRTPRKNLPRGSPKLFIWTLVVIAPGFVLGQLLGAGSAAIVGGYVALFAVLSSMGGSLRANLHRLAFVGPIVAIGTIVPPLLTQVSRPGAIAFATLTVLVAGLLPLRSPRYESTALGIGMGALLGYSMRLGTTTALQLILAAVIGLCVAFTVLLVTGLQDPSGPTRRYITELFDEESYAFASAFESWQNDKSQRWLGTVLESAMRYRIARRVVARSSDPDGRLAVELVAATARAAAIADAVRSKTPPVEPEALPLDPVTPNPGSPAVVEMFAALDSADRANRRRDSRPVRKSGIMLARVAADRVRATVGYGAVQIRYAFRSAFAVLVAFLVSLAIQPTDPLLSTLLLTTFSLVQASWRATLSRAKARFVGVLVGGALVALILAFVPTSFLFPISMAALVVSMWFLTTHPATGAAALIVMSVGLNYQVRHLNPGDVAIEYLLLTGVAVLIGTVIGFVVVPSWKPAPLAERVESAVVITAEALLAQDPRDTGHADPQWHLMSDAQAAVRQLVPDHETIGDGQVDELDDFRHDLRDLLAASIFLVTTDPSAAPALGDAARSLQANAPSAPQGLEPDEPSKTLLFLAHEVVVQRAKLEATLA